ncbi:thiamine/thiamine pyrophosphate ABC transporter permease ThiP [Oceanomicrobium pacificus]|uniref:ABC transporter permease subunit n=1 Tax=Oceanomicrobium pacificus TaxID=2692916 RepID=A0A6B0TM18_9RHOB|nr:thiamine/thiamine pyrophosphate ABC transporter permease ThiP [Oceanomicrobium pacificus]MXU64946.1 ABC transporter permease subunit [Oceanomicrobium pacificus]
MARGAEPVSLVPRLAGGAALLVLAALTLGAILLLGAQADTGWRLDPADWAALRFTLWQSFLSATLSCLLAVPLARALFRRRFPGHRLYVAFLGAPFILPAIVAVLGLLAVWGRSGLLSDLIAPLGFGPLDIYGLRGVVLAHLFFNLPLVTRILLQGWVGIPREHFRLARQLGFTPRDQFRHLEAPMLRRSLSGAFLLVFLLCMTSFAVALTLGGGPKATTIELAIYQALRFEFDLGHAAFLALIQFTLCALAALLALGVGRGVLDLKGAVAVGRPTLADGRVARAADRAVLALGGLFLLLPLGMIGVRGLPELVVGLPAQVWPAALRSVLVALASAFLCLMMALALSAFIDTLRGRRAGLALAGDVVGVLTLAASPFVIGTALFIAINPFADPFALALPVTALVNAAMSLPFALRVISPAWTEITRAYGGLSESVGLRGWQRVRLLYWPLLRRPAGFATGLSAALSMGDLGVIALFATPDRGTLPLVMHQLMGAYRSDAAAGVALLLLALSAALFWIFDRGGRIDTRL